MISSCIEDFPSISHYIYPIIISYKTIGFWGVSPWEGIAAIDVCAPSISTPGLDLDAFRGDAFRGDGGRRAGEGRRRGEGRRLWRGGGL